jgi:hypothetical protein
MKKTIAFILILAVVCGVCSLVTHHFAYAAGFAQARQLQKGTFVGSLDALQKLRAGNIPDTTERIETLCFLSAELLYSDPAFRDDFLTKTLLPDLIQYRASYRANGSEWTPVERKLEATLAKWK